MHNLEQDLAGWTIAFDLDGTLVDTAPDLIGTLNVVLAEQGLPAAAMSDVRQLVGHGVRGMLIKAYRMNGLEIGEDKVVELRPRFIALYQARIARESRPFPGCLEALAALRARGARLAVCTNKPSGLASQLLAELDMAGCFDAVLGGDTLPVQKPDPAPLLEAVRLAGGDPARAILVGDASPDTGAAKTAGIPCVVLTFGYNDLPADELGGDARIDSYGELAGAIDRIAATCRAPVESL